MIAMSALQLNNVWKRYYIEYERRNSLRQTFLNFLKGKSKNEFWALKNIDLEIKQGETLGIIGRNGSGKTTLLRLICGVTKATKGFIKINGRVAGLLELGAGFQGDLTGIENIYLNGLILGISKTRIRKKMNSIIDFADIGDFIDAPVRTYSAGMYMRLGFSIAMQLKPNILLIDEVLAIGDASFQKKCTDKIKELKNEGRTFILVSHDTSFIRGLCDKAIWLDEGMIVKEDKADEVVREYEFSISNHKYKKLNKEIEIKDVSFLDSVGTSQSIFRTGEPLTIRIGYFAHNKIKDPIFGIAIHRNDGFHIAGPNTRFSGFRIDSVEGKGAIDFIIEKLPFLSGAYEISVSIHNEDIIYDSCWRLFKFEVVAGDTKERHGILFIPHRWKLV